MPLLNWNVAIATALCGLAASQPGLAQMAPATILEIDTENYVEYVDDAATRSDPSKIAATPGVTHSAGPPFGRIVGLADIIAVNDQPAKGLVFEWEVGVGASPTPTPGQAIADTRTLAMRYQTFQVLQNDDTPVGTIMSLGLSQPGGATVPPPPGAPLAQTSQQYAIAGGTGAFLGARGQQGQENTPQTATARVASMAEDPANRRINGGGRIRFILHVIPMSVPQIVTTSVGPAVTHSSDFTLVTASKPAAPGEILTLFATGLGPTKPGVDPGKPFLASPLSVVNSPIQVLVNGKAADVMAAVGFPGAVDGYQVNFRVPPDTAKGPATVQVVAAWIQGTAATIMVQ